MLITFLMTATALFQFTVAVYIITLNWKNRNEPWFSRSLWFWPCVPTALGLLLVYLI